MSCKVITRCKPASPVESLDSSFTATVGPDALSKKPKMASEDNTQQLIQKLVPSTQLLTQSQLDEPVSTGLAPKSSADRSVNSGKASRPVVSDLQKSSKPRKSKRAGATNASMLEESTAIPQLVPAISLQP